jgi:hypothetical protein
MYERLLDKNNKPTSEQVKEYLGAGFERLVSLENELQRRYDFSKDMRFPYGNSYGWGYKYSHKSSHLCDAFFESGAFTVLFQIGDKQVPLMESQLPSLLQKTQELWKNRYLCGKQGGWIHYQVLTDAELADVIQLITIRKKPPQ